MAVTTIKKSPLGKEDLYFDTDGTHEVVSIPTSTGGIRSVKRINGTHIPIIVATRNLLRADGTATNATDVDAALAELYADNANQGIPDDLTIEVSSGTMQLKDAGGSAGVTTAKLQDDCVTAAKLADDASVDGNRAVTTNHLRDDCVTQAKINAGAVDTTELATDAVTADKIEAGAVATSELADDAVTSDKMDLDGSLNGPGFFCVAAGTHTLTGGATTEVKAIPGGGKQSTAGTGDILIVSPKSGFTQAINLVNATLSNSNEITYDTETGNIPAGAVVYYAVFKACT